MEPHRDNDPNVFPVLLVGLVETVVAIALDGEAGRRSTAKRSAPRPFLHLFRSLCPALVRAGILATEGGAANGGVWMIVPPETVSVGDLARIIKAHQCPRENGQQASTLSGLNQLRSRMVAELDALTIGDLVRHQSRRAA